MRSIAVAIGLGLALASCFIKPDRPGASGADDAGGDGGGGSQVPLCANGKPATLYDDFSGSGSACGGGVAMTSEMTLQRAMGQLQFVPLAGKSGYANCRFPTAAQAVIVQWATLTSDATFDFAGVSLVGTDNFSLTLNLEYPSVLRGRASNMCIPNGTLAWTSAFVWWRLTAVASDIVADASKDGRNWLAVATGTDNQPVQVATIIVAYENDIGDSKTVAADAIYTCP